MTKHLFRLALLAATLPAVSLVGQAAPRQDAPTQAGPRGATMFKDLNLTADQQAKVEALLKEAQAQRGPRPSGPPTDAERQAIQARRADMDTKLKAILTPEQYTKYQAARPQRGPRGGQPGPTN